MSQRSPGPWEFRKDGFVYSLATGECVCSPHSTLAEHHRVSDQIKDLKRNARLIAAAPELLESLQLLIDWFNSDSREPIAAPIKPALRAIAKATGEKRERQD
jgi:hypothetical protein